MFGNHAILANQPFHKKARKMGLSSKQEASLHLTEQAGCSKVFSWLELHFLSRVVVIFLMDCARWAGGPSFSPLVFTVG